MARRDIRRMLMESKKKKRGFFDRPGAVPAVLVLVLVLGIGVGAGVGALFGGKHPTVQPAAVVVESSLDRPARREPDEGLLTAPPLHPSPSDFADEPAPAEVAPPPPRQEALIVPQPAIQPRHNGPAVWLANAVPAPSTGGRPMIAVVIDDLGLDKRRTERVTTLRAPLTLAFMTYAEDLARQTAEAHARGHELMVHMPMQPEKNSFDPGPDVLRVDQSADEMRRRMDWGLGRFQGYVGVNNHMGSRFTADSAGMRVVMDELSRRGLMFLDSVTTDHSAAADAARQYGVPFAARQVFLDNEQSVAAIRAQLDRLEALARKHGAAIAIGHPHDSTIEALAGWLPTLAGRGFALVPVTAIVKAGGAKG